MDGFWELLSEFSKSELAKNYWFVFIALLVALVMLFGTLIWLYMEKIKFPSKYIELQNKVSKIEEIEKENQGLKEQVEELKKQNDGLKEEFQNYKFFKSVNRKDNFEDKALDAFAKKR